MNENNLFGKVEEWARVRGIDKNDPSKQMLKVVEEVGEVAAALARSEREELLDGIGDSIVTLIILAQQSGLNALDCLESAYNVIAARKGKVINGVFVKEEDLSKLSEWTPAPEGITPVGSSWDSFKTEAEQISELIKEVSAEEAARNTAKDVIESELKVINEYFAAAKEAEMDYPALDSLSDWLGTPSIVNGQEESTYLEVIKMFSEGALNEKTN